MLSKEQIEARRAEAVNAAAFAMAPSNTAYHRDMATICDMALESMRPDSSGEAVREACAKVCEGMANEAMEKYGPEDGAVECYKDCADAIRSLPTLPAASGWEADARRYRWLNRQDNFLAYIVHQSGEKTYRLKCGEPLNTWIDARLAEEVALPAPPAAGDV